MARGKMHYRDPFSRDMSLCGNYPPTTNLTGTQRNVTCIKCRKSLGLAVAPPTPKAPKPAPTFDFEVTDDVKKALKHVGKTMGAWAERTNQCNTYDQAITYLNTKMPEGVAVPGRFSQWNIRLENPDGEAMTIKVTAASGNAALRWVKENAFRVYNTNLDKIKVSLVGEAE